MLPYTPQSVEHGSSSIGFCSGLSWPPLDNRIWTNDQPIDSGPVVAAEPRRHGAKSSAAFVNRWFVAEDFTRRVTMQASNAEARKNLDLKQSQTVCNPEAHSDGLILKINRRTFIAHLDVAPQSGKTVPYNLEIDFFPVRATSRGVASPHLP